MSLLVVLISGVVGWYYYERAKSDQAALSEARYKYQQLGSKLGSLQSEKSSIISLDKGLDIADQQYRAAWSSADTLSRRIHEETQHDYNIDTEYDEAERGLLSFEDAQSAQKSVEAVDSRIVTEYRNLYGEEPTRQLSTDLASTNESRENSITEWLRAMSSISDDLSARMNGRIMPYQMSDIAAEYTESNRDSNDAERYENLAAADLQVLRSRLADDIGSVESQMASMRSKDPNLIK